MRNARKRPLCNLADNAGPGQTAHLRRLIWASIDRLQNGYCTICRRTKAAQIRLHGCTGSSGPSLFARGVRAFFPRWTLFISKGTEGPILLNRSINDPDEPAYLYTLLTSHSLFFLYEGPAKSSVTNWLPKFYPRYILKSFTALEWCVE